MRIRLNEDGKQRSFSVDCLHDNIVVESLVVVLTLVSGLAITGENLMLFDLITVPQYGKSASNITTGNHTVGGERTVVITENAHVKNILIKVFHFTSLSIAGLFFVEIVLKVCTLQRKFITNPWQIFDTVVVVATLALELVFHFIFLSERAIYLLTYIVLLRLWRLHMLCSIRAKAVQEASDWDTELYRSGRLKAEEKCRMLEKTLSKQAETIKKLEKMVNNLTRSKQSDHVISNGHIKTNGQLLYKTNEANTSSTDMNDSQFLLTSERSSDLNFLRSSKKTSQNIPPDEMETKFMFASEAEKSVLLHKLKSQTSEVVPNKENMLVYQTKSRISCDNTVTVESTKTDSDCVDIPVNTLTERKLLPFLAASDNLLTFSSQQRHNMLRQRKRRSSASEILDCGSLTSLDMDTKLHENGQKSLSFQSLSSDTDQLFTKDIHENKHSDNIIDHKPKKSISNTSDSRNELMDVTLEEKKDGQNMRRTRRFISCPEYVYTQRMTITNDESLLIQGGHTTEDPIVYNNLGFDIGENGFFEIMSEYDGTMTYRNEDGIPMTSL